jgi:hypothetical protein
VLNLGDVRFGINADATGLAAAQKIIQSFGDSLTRSVKSSKGDIDATTAALIKQEGAALRALQQVQALQAKIASTKLGPGVADDLTAKLQQAYTQTAAGLTSSKKPLDALAMQREQLGFAEQIGATNRELAAQARAAKEVADATAFMANAQRTEANAANAAYDKQIQAVMRYEAQVKQLQANIANASGGRLSPKIAQGYDEQLTQSLNQFRSAVSTGGGDKDPLNSTEFLAASLKMKGALSSVRSEFQSTRSAVSVFDASMRGIGDALILSTGPFGMFAFRVRAASDLMKEFGLVAGGSVDVTLKAITGSSALAAGELDYLRDTADKAGLKFQELSGYFGRFEASATSTGQSLSVTHDEFTKLALVMGTLHLQTDQAGNVIRTFDEILSQGYVQGRNVTRQLATELPGAMDISKVAAAAMTGQLKETGAQLEKLLSTKQVSGPEFVKAFIDAYAEFIKLDPSKNIDTLQGGLNRLSNAWNLLLINTSNAVGGATFFGDSIKGLDGILRGMATSVAGILPLIAAFVGGVLGLAAAFATLFIIQTTIGVIGTLSSAFGNLIFLMRSATTVTDALAAAQLLLDGALISNPIGIVVLALSALVAALLGANFAMDQMKRATLASNSALSDNQGIKDYIAQQQTLKTVVESTNNEMLKQAEIAARNSLSSSIQANNDFLDKSQMNRGLKSIGATGNSPLAQMLGATDSQVTNMAQHAKLAAANAKDALQAVADIQKIGTKPANNQMGIGSPGEVKEPKGRGGGSEFAGLSSLDKLIEDGKAAQQVFQNLLNNPTQDNKLAEDIAKATDQVNALKLAQKEALAQTDPKTRSNALAASAKDIAHWISTINTELGSGLAKNASFDQIAQALVPFITKTRESTDAAKEFTTVLDAVHKAQATAAASNEVLQQAISGGATTTGRNARDGAMESGLKQAEDLLAGLKQAGAPGQQMLEVLNRMFVTTGSNAKDLAHALGQIFAAPAQNDEVKKAIDKVNDSLHTTQYNLAELKTTSLGQLFNVQNLQTATEALKGFNPTQIDEFNTYLKSMGITLTGVGTAASQAAQGYATLIGRMNEVAHATDMHNQALNQQIQAWDTWGDGAVDNLWKVAQGQESVVEGFKNIGYTLANTIVSSALLDPIKNVIHQGIYNMFTGGTLFGATSIGGIFGGIGNAAKGGGIGAATAQTAAQQAQTAALLTSNTSLLGFDAAIASATAALATMGAMDAASAVPDAAKLFSDVPFATGGQVLGPGTGTSDDIAAWLSNGEFVINAEATRSNLGLLKYINSGKSLKMGGVGKGAFADGGLVGSGFSATVSAGSGGDIYHSSTAIDGRAYIDARGATEDAIAGIRREMAMRDAQLQSQIPYMIDSRIIDNKRRGRAAAF